MNGAEMDTVPPSGAVFLESCADAIDGHVRRYRLGTATHLEVVAEVKNVVDHFLKVSYGDPRIIDRDLFLAWSYEQVSDLCDRGATPAGARALQLYDLWVAERIAGGAGRAEIELRLHSLAAHFRTNRDDAEAELVAWATSGEPMPVWLVAELAEIARDNGCGGVLASMLEPHGLARHYPTNTGLLIHVLNLLTELATMPERGTSALDGLIELVADTELAGHAAIRLPVHVLNSRQRGRLLEVGIDWDEAFPSAAPWHLPEGLQIARLAVSALLLRVVDATYLSC